LKKNILKYFFLFLSTFSLLEANEIALLLEKYQAESELSKKTKDENAGHLIVFTRDDLERMQVETLKDVLKSIRLFRYLENRVGEPDMLNIDPVLYSSKSVRVYLNDNELELPITGSGFLMFGNIDMDFIDHVEIYEGFPSFEFGVEPATVVIRLYSKNAQHDSGSRIKGLIASHSSNKENIYTSGYVDDMAYFAYVNHSDDDKKVYNIDNQEVKRNFHTNHFYGSLSQDNYKLELNALEVKHDAFLGMLPYTVPQNANMDRNYINASFSAKSADKTLSFNASYIYSSGDYQAQYPAPLAAAFGGYTTLHQNYKTDTLTVIGKKEFKFNTNTLVLGLQYRYKYFKFDDITYNGIASNIPQNYNKENIYSIFFEDTFFLSQNDLLSISLMQQYYARNKGMKNESMPQLRLSYVHVKDAWTSKTFLSRQEFIPEPFMTATPVVGNPKLDSEIYNAFTQEINYKTKQTLSKLLVGYSVTNKFLMPNSHGVMQNSKKDLDIYLASAEFTYFFRTKDKLELQIDYAKLKGSDYYEDNTHINYLIRMLNSVGKFDIFNELIINSGFENLDTGYDYSAGIKYRATPDLHFGLKGENIFKSGLTRKYYYHIVPMPQQLEVPVIEQKFMLSMEYLF